MDPGLTAIAIFFALLLLIALPKGKQGIGRLDRLDELILEEIEPKIQRLSRAGRAALRKRLEE